MMKLLNKTTIFLIFLGLILSSCATTNKMTMGVLEPAPVYMPKDNQKIGIIDRSLPSDENAELDKLDKIYRMNWACVDARVKGQQVEGNINPNIIFERHYVLNWLTNHQNQDWDDVQTNT